MDIDLVEFQQLQEVGIFSYLRYSLAKSLVINGYKCSEVCFSRKFGFKSFEPSGENSYLSGRE